MMRAMKPARRIACCALAALALASWCRPAHANPMDITLSRFVTEACGELGLPECEDVVDVEGFRNISRELGFAMAPFLLAPAETLGYSGFYTGLEGQVTIIDNKADYWIKGTEEQKPAGALFLSAVHARKGLPGGLELGASLGYMAQTEQVALGMDIRFSPFQGWRKGVGGAFPDLAIRGSVMNLMGEDELNLTVVGVDASLSYAITIMQQATLTPYFGYQFLWIIADAEVVDATPGRNFFGECGTPLGDCTGGDPSDSHNLIDFSRTYIHMNRLTLGVRFIYEFLAVTAQYGIGLPANKHDKDNDAPIMHQITFGVGADY